MKLMVLYMNFQKCKCKLLVTHPHLSRYRIASRATSSLSLSLQVDLGGQHPFCARGNPPPCRPTLKDRLHATILFFTFIQASNFPTLEWLLCTSLVFQNEGQLTIVQNHKTNDVAVVCKTVDGMEQKKNLAWKTRK